MITPATICFMISTAGALALAWSYRSMWRKTEWRHHQAHIGRDDYATRWGRSMNLLRKAEEANKALRTELMRRQNAEKIAA